MNYKFLYVFLLLSEFLLLSVSSAEELPAKVELHFYGKSTLHDFSGKVTTSPFFLQISEKTNKLSADVIFNVSDMNTENAKRDKKMHTMFENSKYPTVTASIEDIQAPSEGVSVIPLKITIHGKTLICQANVVDWNNDKKNLSARLEFDISLTSFDLKPPSVLGLINVSDTVHVECDVMATHSNN